MRKLQHPIQNYWGMASSEAGGLLFKLQLGVAYAIVLKRTV